MLHDARRLPDEQAFDADICIIGGGAAGITIAREFLNTAHRVILLESGGLDLEADTQDLYRGQNVGRPYYDLDVCRLRYFGGTTNHWAGWCRPLSPIDFEKRSWIPNSGWPIRYEDIVPFFPRAAQVLQIGNAGFDAEHLARGFPETGRFPFDEQRIQAKCYQFSPPTRFGKVYGKALFKAANISALLHANVVAIDADQSGKQIGSVGYATLTGKKGRVRARTFILASGGIENARLLLFANIGNDSDKVGRYFMEHPEPDGGLFLMIDQHDPRWIPYIYNHPARRGPRGPLGCIAIAKTLQDREQILNTRFNFNYLPNFYSDGYAALQRVLGRGEGASGAGKGFASDLWTILSDIEGTARDTTARLTKGRTVAQMVQIEMHGQQAPNPDSRVTLSDERDALGIPRVKLDWRLTDFEKHSVRRALHIAAQEFGRLGLGRMKIAFKDWEPDFFYGNHHIGTTRMSSDPRQGVVDANCRVHGVANLYVAGSSVFATSGNAPPTYTIVALALRLADHLKSSPVARA